MLDIDNSRKFRYFKIEPTAKGLIKGINTVRRDGRYISMKEMQEYMPPLLNIRKLIRSRHSELFQIGVDDMRVYDVFRMLIGLKYKVLLYIPSKTGAPPSRPQIGKSKKTICQNAHDIINKALDKLLAVMESKYTADEITHRFTPTQMEQLTKRRSDCQCSTFADLLRFTGVEMLYVEEHDRFGKPKLLPSLVADDM